MKLLAVVGLPSAMLLEVTAPPVPDNETMFGLLEAELVIVRLPVRAPETNGRKVTETVQEAPGASEAQLLVCVKSPDGVTEEIVAAAEPVFDTDTVCTALAPPTGVAGNVRLVGLVAIVPTGVPVSPVPVSDTVAAPLPALLLTVSVPVRVPVADGRKVTYTTHEEPVSKLPQLLVWV